ncbi:hypothetical protein JXA32_00970 [Candidatus Sumerlaeota bacterium]|nr:hypothetical protein [Candidatus Sumerlaeota bacterium]
MFASWLRLVRIVTICCLFSGSFFTLHAAPSNAPLLTINDVRYIGAFRLPEDTFGVSSLNYSQGPMAYYPSHHSILIVGHTYEQAIAEFAIPRLVKSTNIEDLNMASAPLQFFSSVIDRASNGNPQALDSIGGMLVFDGPDGPQLLVNAYEYYDAPGDNTQTTLIVRDADDLASCAVDGFYSFQGGAGHTSGWISPVPPEWIPEIGASYITGQSSGIPIISRCSVGPSAFAFDPAEIIGADSTTATISTIKLLDFSLDHPLHDDLYNSSGTNDLWTHLSRVTYGLIVPGTRTYITFGYSGGHVSGVCYKCTQDDGNLCGGYCAYEADDYYQYCWLWDVNDLIKVRQGRINSYDVRPYEYGKFPTPFECSTHEIGGGAYDVESGKLYLTIQRADSEQGTYSNPPIVVVFRFEMRGAQSHDQWQLYARQPSDENIAFTKKDAD